MFYFFFLCFFTYLLLGVILYFSLALRIILDKIGEKSFNST